jgi:sulfite reductase beta subunit-like hemoprotein
MATGDGLIVRLHPPGGMLNAAQVDAIAMGAARHGNGLVDVTARGNLQIRGVSERSHPPLAAMLAAEFQIVTGEGDVYSAEMGFSWLKEAGFSPVRHTPFDGPASLVVGEAV